MSTTNRVVGWIDSRRRPLINLRVSPDRTVSAVVDTGFNGYLLWEGTPTNLSDFPGELSALYESVEVAGGQILAALATMPIQWFAEGAYTSFETLVALSDKRHRPGDPMVFVGTALLSGKMLVIDFTEETVRIQRST